MEFLICIEASMSALLPGLNKGTAEILLVLGQEELLIGVIFCSFYICNTQSFPHYDREKKQSPREPRLSLYGQWIALDTFLDFGSNLLQIASIFPLNDNKALDH